MTMFVARYDLRSPADSATSRTELYATALEQAAWAEAHGFDMLVLSEHHGVDDGYLPSPLIMAAAFAGRTRTIPITISALLAPLYEPLRLAEDLAVLDHASGGRVSYVLGLGYREEEYEQMGLDFAARGARMEHVVETLLQAFTGEPFSFEGRTVRTTPTPIGPQPMLFYGGGTKVAARRAAKYGLGFFPQHADPAICEEYTRESERLGKGPGFVLAPPEGPGTVYCAEDPDACWDAIGEHLLYEARAYHAWQKGVTSAVHDSSETVEEMRKAGIYCVLTPDEMIRMATDDGIMALTTHPLCGGIPPELSWQSLKLIGEVVIPAVKA
jgi:alkanesulfonate monooxygenase SsuD/methylene tetrahydromethanopterin reductase-like flavin-dependent oxidoreductase (luciferase family)